VIFHVGQKIFHCQLLVSRRSAGATNLKTIQKDVGVIVSFARTNGIAGNYAIRNQRKTLCLNGVARGLYET